MKNINDKPSEKSVYIWNITGSIANALFSIVTLMIVTRILDERQADIFSIAWTISQLMATVGTFQIRMYQATDVTGVFRFRQYWNYRILTIVIMMLSSYVYILMREYTGEKAFVILLVCFFRAVDSMADVYEGWFQQKERLDLSGKALTYRIVVAVVGFGLGLLVTRNLTIACLALVLTYFLCFLWYDVRYYRKVLVFQEKKPDLTGDLGWIVKMTKEGFPLFINSFLMMSIMNAPKMVLDSMIDNGQLAQGVQTIFNIIFMPAAFLNLAYIVFRPLITKMAIVWSVGKKREFLKILAKILISLVGISILLFLGSALLGIPILSIVYAVELQEYKTELLLIIVGGCMYTFAAVLDNALVVIRQQYILILAYVFTYVYIKFASKFMTEALGVFGASLSYLSAMTVFLMITALMFIISFYYMSKKVKSENIK